MIKAILLYSAWVSGVLLIAGFLSFVYKFWWSLYALSSLDDNNYTVIVTTPFSNLSIIRPICEQNGISYNLVYFARLISHFFQKKEVI